MPYEGHPYRDAHFEAPPPTASVAFVILWLVIEMVVAYVMNH